MHPHLFLSIIILLFTTVPISLCNDDERYTNCTRTFNCGAIKSIGFPFWGNGRPDYCGLPEFELTCRNNSPEIEISSERYNVLGINETSQILSLNRNDTWNGTCPGRFFNTTFDFNSFNYTEDVENVSLFYGCSVRRELNVSNRLSCQFNGSISDAFFITGPVPTDQNLNLTKCNLTVVVPVLKKDVEGFTGNWSALGEVLRKGFELKYESYIALCSQCKISGGEYGYNWTLKEPTCFCKDEPHSLTCSGNKSNWKKKLIIGFCTGVGGFLMTCFMFFLISRFRTKKQSKFSGLISRNISSNPSSKPDLEKPGNYLGIPIFTYHELEEATDNFNPSKELGDGGFGTVYHGKLRDGRFVAVKRLYDNNYKRVQQFMNEVHILTHLHHKNLVILYGCTSRQSRELLLVYEFIPNGTVADHLHGHRAKDGPLTWPIRMSIAIETASALAYLHDSNIIHRDVKTNNILLDNNFSVKVADFGLSRLFPRDATHVSTAPQGTPGYVDPEYYQSYQLTDKSDVFSFGVVLVELISSKPAVDVNRHRHEINLAAMAVNKIQNSLLHELIDPSLHFEKDFTTKKMIEEMAELAFQCLQHEKELRPSMNEVLRKLKEIDNEKCRVEKIMEVDIVAALVKSSQPLVSPDSVADKWVSRSTTPNASG